jgi:hypothetical protein
MVETVEIRQVMWLVMLKSVNDQILEVDPPKQQVMPCVRYGMTCLLIRGAMESVPRLDEWGVPW